MMLIIMSCSSCVILLSDGRQSPLLKISAPTSTLFPSIQALVLPLPFPSTVTNGFIRYIGCRCIGFHIGRPSALKLFKASKISEGLDFPLSVFQSASFSLRTVAPSHFHQSIGSSAKKIGLFSPVSQAFICTRKSLMPSLYR